MRSLNLTDGRRMMRQYSRNRIKDMNNIGEECIPSLALEDIVSQLSDVGEAAAIGISDEKWGERPLGLVVPA